MLTKPNGFTLIELIMVIVIIAVIGLATSGIIMYFMQNTIFLPNQMNVQQIADAAMDLIIEGDLNAKGLRFAKTITAIGNNTVRFLDIDNKDVQYSISNNSLRRTVFPNPEEIIPYYATGDINITGQNNILFNFYNDAVTEAPASNPADVRRIKINLLVKSGEGNFDNWEGQIILGSSVKIYKFNQNPRFTSGPAATQKTKKSIDIAFGITDDDGGRVAWTAFVSVDPGGTSRLNRSSGSKNVPYSQSIIYTPSPGYSGITIITINLDDGAGGMTTADVSITVS